MSSADSNKRPVLCIVGLGYVGLPLAHAFARAGYRVIGYDLSERRIAELREGKDRTNELTIEQLRAVRIEYGTDPSVIARADIVILAIPTPVDDHNKPDLSPVISATETVGRHLKKGAIVVYESTVYPGVTEETCGPLLEKMSGMTCGVDFTLGYSPERVNPGDKQHTVETIVKIVAGQDAQTADALCALYGSIVRAGIHRAPSIRVAEMAKAIENAQRDLNIAYINEVALLCHRIGIPTKDVLAAAGTKWNFLPFTPGLVGGHCIGVDPYYLVEKAQMLGMTTHVISAGRTVNDTMAAAVARQVLDALETVTGPKRALLLGVTFKEDIPDDRNSKVADVRDALAAGGMEVFAHDPFFTPEELHQRGYQAGSLTGDPYDAVLLLVPHKEYLALAPDALMGAVKEGGVFYDLKSLIDPREVEKGKRYGAL